MIEGHKHEWERANMRKRQRAERDTEERNETEETQKRHTQQDTPHFETAREEAGTAKRNGANATQAQRGGTVERHTCNTKKN